MGNEELISKIAALSHTAQDVLTATEVLADYTSDEHAHVVSFQAFRDRASRAAQEAEQAIEYHEPEYPEEYATLDQEYRDVVAAHQQARGDYERIDALLNTRHRRGGTRGGVWDAIFRFGDELAALIDEARDREQTLSARIDALRAAIAPKEREGTTVRKARHEAGEAYYAARKQAGTEAFDSAMQLPEAVQAKVAADAARAAREARLSDRLQEIAQEINALLMAHET